MVNEVNKLIYNALLKHHALYLPSVGTLSVVRRPAVFSLKNELLPPHFDVEFSSQNCAKSLIDIIFTEADVDTKRAEEIYSRWLDSVQEGSTVVIDGVGVLRDKSFDTDKTLVKALNICSEPLRITRRKSKAPVFIAISLIIICAICGGGWWYLDNQLIAIHSEEDVVEEVVAPVEELSLVVEEKIAEEENVEEPQVVENVVVDWRVRNDIRHWVVVGSYSTIENAERAISDIVKRLPDMQCNYFKLGSMYAVAVFGSADIDECQQFKNNHIKDFAQSWVYTPKRFR